MTADFKVATRGQGPDLVLLHGWGMHSGIWGGVGEALAADFCIHLVDLPGHGINRGTPLSRDLDTVAELVLSKVPTAAWVGWSLGGLVTLGAAMRCPARVKKMALVAASPSFSRQADWDCGVEKAVREEFAKGLESNPEATINQFCLQSFGPGWIDEAYARLGQWPLTDKAPAPEALSTGLQLLYENNLLPMAESCKTPTLYLGGLRDRTVRPESLERAAAMMPKAYSRLIPGAGHAPFISHQQKALDILLEFLHGEQAR